MRTATVNTRLYLLLFAIILLQINGADAQQTQTFKILETVEHNPDYFTQGLELHQGLLFESSGRYGKSKVRKYHPDGDDALLETPIAERFFAEGLTVFDDELFLLTWRENTLIVLDPENLKIKRELMYEGEGWGLASYSNQLVMSDGSDTIYFRNPGSFKIEREMQVYFKQHTVRRINELEFAQGYLWANIWQSPMIVKIKPTTGEVVSFYDFTELVARHSNGNNEKVLNGIAYDAERNAFWITGKLWSRRYLVRLD